MGGFVIQDMDSFSPHVHLGVAGGLESAFKGEYVEVVRQLDEAVRRLDGVTM